MGAIVVGSFVALGACAVIAGALADRRRKIVARKAPR